MRATKAKELTLENFERYGSFASMVEPRNLSVGPEIHAFFCDQLVYYMAPGLPVGLSTSHVRKRPVVVDRTEVHRNCGEVLLPLDGDIYIHVGPRSGLDEADFEKFEIFRVPQGTAVCLRPGTWHFAAFPCTAEAVSVLVMLPERTYANDCVVVDIPEEHQIRLEE